MIFWLSASERGRYMTKIKSLDELIKIRDKARESVSLREKGDNIDNMIRVKVAMATCGRRQRGHG